MSVGIQEVGVPGRFRWQVDEAEGGGGEGQPARRPRRSRAPLAWVTRAS